MRQFARLISSMVLGYASTFTPTPVNITSACDKLNLKVFWAEYIHARQAIGGVDFYFDHHPFQADHCTGEHAG
jgi:hypothetical protein